MDNNHKKPTQEELEAQIKATQEQLDKEIAEDTTPEDTTEDETQDETSDETSREQETDDTFSETVDEETTDETTEESTQPTPEEQLAASTRESQRLAEDERRMNEAHHEANNLPSPTDEELKSAYKDWDLMSDTEKQLATDNLANKRKLEILGKAAEDRRIVEIWNDKVADYIENPKTLIAVPQLEGKQKAFTEYATSKERRNINLTVLTESFLFKQSQEKITGNKGKMFERGNGGEKDKEKPKSDILSVDEGAKLMQSNYKLYKQYLQAGKIANE